MLTAFLKRRWAVATVLTLLAVAATAAASPGHDLPFEAFGVTTLALLFCGTFAYLNLRHAGLAALATIAPLPGLFAASPLVANVPPAALIEFYAIGYVAAGLVGAVAVRALLEGDGAVAAARRSLIETALPLAACVAVVGAMAFGWLFQTAPRQALRVDLGVAAAVVSAWLFVGAGAAALTFDETFFVRVNRTRERRERFLRWITFVTEPRWGLSVAGIVLVLAVLGWFGSASGLDAIGWRAGAAAALGFFVAALAISRDWRSALGATLAVVALTLVSLWLWRLMAGRAAPLPLMGLAEATALVPMFILLDAQRRFRTSGDPAPTARLRALENIGPIVALVCVGSAAVFLPWTALHGAMAPLAYIVLIGSVAAEWGIAALATALEAIVPRRRSVKDLYGRG